MLLIEVEKLGPISLLPLAKHMIMDRATIGHNIRPLEANDYLTLTVGEDRPGPSTCGVGRRRLELIVMS